MKRLVPFLFCLNLIWAQEIVLTEDFSNGNAKGWQVETNSNQRQWETKSYNGIDYMKMSAYDGKGKSVLSVKTDLISPPLNIKNKSCKLRFTFADAFKNGQPLLVFLSTTKGKIQLDQSYWETLVNNPNFYDNVYETTDWIALPETKETAHIIFNYDSKKGAISTTIQLSEVQVHCNETEKNLEN